MVDTRNESTPSRQPQSRARGPFGGGVRAGTLFGIEIRIDASLLIIFALIFYNLGAGVFPAWHAEWSGWTSWLLAFSASVLFFGSVLVHELSHAVVARTQGIPVRRITLFLFGGMAHMERRPPSPKAEFLMAIAGPITSIVIGLAGTFAGIAMAGDTLPDAAALGDAATAATALGDIGPVATLLLWLGPLNLVLGVFNLVPGFPLDGGRVFRSIAWAATGDLVRATKWAARAGQIFAWTLMTFGAMEAFRGAIGSGLWLILIGWFVGAAARASYEDTIVHKALENVPVGRVMRTRFQFVSADLPLESLVRDFLIAGEERAFPVEEHGTLAGLVCFEDVKKAPQGAWGRTPVRAVMTPVDGLETLGPAAPAEQALEALARQDVDQIPIVHAGRLVGLVRRGDILKWLALQGRTSLWG